MESIVLYRLPYAREYVRLVQHGEPEELSAYTALNGKAGFVFAPFAIGEDTPVLLIHPDEVFRQNDFFFRHNDIMTDILSKDKERYAVDFANFHAQLEQGVFRKIVLARSMEVEAEADAEALFFEACGRYPRMFVALVSTPGSGTWLMATPEVLLEGNGTQWRTMALAGTMKLEGEQLGFDVPLGDLSQQITWSTKDIQEQRLVATYLTECLEQFTGDFTEEGPYTSRAGDLVHLRSDFTFTMQDNDRLGNVIDRLHPTPAVCGIPKEAARQFIIRNEASPRRYYSGFVGPLNPDGDTHLFVSLRCMEMTGDRCRLYAGGGLLRDSVEEREWEETEAKMETMLRLLT